MLDWNIVVSVRDGGYPAARELLEQFAQVSRTHYFNVLVAKVDDPRGLLEILTELAETLPEIPEFLASVVPLIVMFDFSSAEHFEEQARQAVQGWADKLAGKTFHVRVHRRGHKQDLPSIKEEQMLDGVLLAATEKSGAPSRVTFDDPDAIVAVETVDNRAGLSLWSRDDLRRFRLLGLD